MEKSAKERATRGPMKRNAGRIKMRIKKAGKRRSFSRPGKEWKGCQTWVG
jgi:hypothetical protein